MADTPWLGRDPASFNFQNIIYTKAAGVARVTINRPQVRTRRVRKVDWRERYHKAQNTALRVKKAARLAANRKGEA